MPDSPQTSHLRRRRGRYRRRQPAGGPDQAAGALDPQAGGGSGARRLRRPVRPQGRGLRRSDPGRRQRRRRHQGEDRHRERDLRHDRDRPRRDVRQRHRRPGRGAAACSSTISRPASSTSGVAEAVVKGIADGLRRVRLRPDRRRDRRDAGPLRRRRLRSRGLRRRRRRARNAAAAERAQGRRRGVRAAVVRRAFQRLFARAANRPGFGARLGPACAVRAVALARRARC